MTVIPGAQGCKLRMAEIALEIARHAWHMAQITALAVALGETREDAEDLRGALRAEKGEGRTKRCLVETRIVLSERAISIEQPIGQGEVDIDAGILEKRSQIKGRMAEDTVLRVDEADPLDAATLRQPHQIGRMIVAHNPDRRIMIGERKELGPGLEELGPVLVGGNRGLGKRPEPVEHQLDLDGHRLAVIG